MRVMITGGGTGGHTSPAAALIEELRRRDPVLIVQWAGRRGKLEERVAARMEVPFRRVPMEGWPRRRGLRQGWVGVKLALSLVQAVLYIRKFQPQIVVGTGGYVSLPVLLAAQWLGLPTMIHEQNKRLGLANRLAARRAIRIFLSFPDTAGDYPEDRARLVGNPVRAGFVAPPMPEEAKATLGLDPRTPVVLVSGGSQGAQRINDALAAILDRFGPQEAQFIWMTGPAGAEAARPVAQTVGPAVHVYPYIEDMVTACAAADVIVSRAGASSTAEIASLGKPSILVPYPHATDNHQMENARAFEAAGAAQVLADHECTPEALGDALQRLLGDREMREAMGQAAGTLAQPLAAEHVVEEIMVQVFGEVGDEPASPT